jgi:hypothetical protein
MPGANHNDECPTEQIKLGEVFALLLRQLGTLLAQSDHPLQDSFRVPERAPQRIRAHACN